MTGYSGYKLAPRVNICHLHLRHTNQLILPKVHEALEDSLTFALEGLIRNINKSIFILIVFWEKAISRTCY
jgi:hypothetical protein